MKKALGLVLLVAFLIGAVSTWTFFEQERRYRDELERLGRPRLLARLSVVARERAVDGNWRTTLDVVRLDAKGASMSPVTCTLEGLETLLGTGPDGKPEPLAPGAACNLILDADGTLRLVPTPSARR